MNSEEDCEDQQGPHDVQQGSNDVFSATLEQALARQKDIFLQEIESRFGNGITKKPTEGKFDFKNEGLKRQYQFNNDRLEAFNKIDSLCSSDTRKADAIKSIVSSEVETINKRIKLLKIADRHGWDTVREYSDDPLADNEEDAAKLRGAISRANRARKPKPYDASQRQSNVSYQPRQGQSFQGSFRYQSPFRGVAPGNEQGFQNPYGRGASGKGSTVATACFACNLPGHYARECPYVQRNTATRRQPPSFPGEADVMQGKDTDK